MDRLRQLEDRAEIQELVVLHGFAMDERDGEVTRALFCEHARLRSADGVMTAEGAAGIVAAYRERWSVLGPTNHVSHGHVIRFGDDPDRARGLVAAHAEVVRHGVAMVTALRYEDEYHRREGRWRFHAREMSYMYYLPAHEYAAGLPTSRGMRVYEEPGEAQWPWARHGNAGRLAGWL